MSVTAYGGGVGERAWVGVRPAVLAILLVAAGCGSGTPGGPPPAGGSRALASITVTGGLCADGPCVDGVEVDADGGWRRTENGRVVADGRLPGDRVRDLGTALAGSAITAGPLPPFTGTCPTAYDGFEVTYEFRVRDVVHRAATCSVVVPPGDPGARALTGLRAELIASAR